MADNAVTAAAPTAAEPKGTAANIVKGIQEKANGSKPTPETNGTSPATPPVDPNAGKKKYVIDGQEEWLTPQEADAYVQKAKSYEKKLTKMAHLQNETTQLYQALLNDPGAVLSNLAKQANVPMKSLVQKVLSGNADEEIKEAVGAWYYENAVEPLKLSPEELEARQNKKKLTAYEQQEKERNEMALRQENQARVQQAMNQIKAQIAEAMQDSGLPTNDSPLGVEMARMVAEVMRLSHMNREPVTPKQAIEYVKKRLKEVQTSFYDSLEGEALVKELGEANAEKVKKYFLKLVKDQEKQIPAEQKTLTPSGGRGERKTISPDDFRDYLEQRKRNG